MKDVPGEVRLVFLGFSASGKTSLGEFLKKNLGLVVVDLDLYIEQVAQKKIAEIIRVEGEEAFRKKEENALREVLGSDARIIILGGGALTREANRALLLSKAASGEIKLISLLVSPAVAAKRVFQDEKEAMAAGNAEVLRPLLIVNEKDSLESCEKAVLELMKKREGLYDLSPVKLWTDWASTEFVARKAIDLAELESDVSVVSMPAFAESQSLGEVRIGRGMLADFAKSIKQVYPKAEKLALLVDENVWRFSKKKIEDSLENQGFEIRVLELDSGEKTKSFSYLEKALDKLLEFELSRSDVVVGIGGGVVGDLAGLVASLYARGVGLVHLPTTIVAQVDSAIGGKTAVNLTGGKNLVGTFYPAGLVYSELELLDSLPEREFKAGLAEVIKYGLIYSKGFYNWFEDNIGDICKRNPAAIKKIVEESSKSKLDFVCKDLRDLSGRRAMLNYGHTLGHVLEKLTGYGELLHGEAVSIGMVFALFLGSALSMGPSKKEQEDVAKLLRACGLPTKMPMNLVEGAEAFIADGKLKLDGSGKIIRGVELELDKLSGAAKSFYQRFYSVFFADKKRLSNSVHFVLLSQIGEAVIQEVAVCDLIDAVALWAISSQN